MKKNEVKVGGNYTAKVGDKLVTVRIDSAHSSGGWSATNTRTGKRIRIKSAQRLRGRAKVAGKAEASEAPKVAIAKNEKAKAAGAAAAKKTKSKRKGGAKAAVVETMDAATKAEVGAKSAKAKKDDGEKRPKRISALDAAAQVLAKAGKPMKAQELIAAMAEQNLWKSPAGKTPHATLYAAMMRDARDKGSASRFRKVDRGMFAVNNAGA